MSKKKKTSVKAEVQPLFTSNPFNSLKGIMVVEPPETVAKPMQEKPAISAALDDFDLFLQAVSDVNPLDGKRLQKNNLKKEHQNYPAQPASRKDKETIDEVDKAEFMKEIKNLKLEVKFTETLPDEELLKPLGGNRLRQLKRGVITLQRQLDLHGLTREEALQSLSAFTKTARNSGEKAVLVITGKGNNSAGEPVIQQAVSSWLRDSGQRELIVEFTPAPREFGGSGAFVVFLRGVKPDKP